MMLGLVPTAMVMAEFEEMPDEVYSHVLLLGDC
jgi:hypothetical protein